MNYAEVLAKSKQNNLTEIAAQTGFFMEENKVLHQNTFIDEIGVGGGVVDALLSQRKMVRGINVGQVAVDVVKFSNKRAEAYWGLRTWIKKGGKLCGCHKYDWLQLTKVKYKPDRKGRLQIMSKDEMRTQGIDSPDTADGLMLTFVRSDHYETEQVKMRRMMKKKRRENKVKGRGLSLTMGGY